MHRIRRLRSAQSWLMTKPASIVLPRPTSSARIAPRDKGERNEKSAASIWWGFKSTVALKMDLFNFCESWAEHCLVRQKPKNLEWYGVLTFVPPRFTASCSSCRRRCTVPLLLSSPVLTARSFGKWYVNGWASRRGSKAVQLARPIVTNRADRAACRFESVFKRQQIGLDPQELSPLTGPPAQRMGLPSPSRKSKPMVDRRRAVVKRFGQSGEPTQTVGKAVSSPLTGRSPPAPRKSWDDGDGLRKGLSAAPWVSSPSPSFSIPSPLPFPSGATDFGDDGRRIPEIRISDRRSFRWNRIGEGMGTH